MKSSKKKILIGILVPLALVLSISCSFMTKKAEEENAICWMSLQDALDQNRVQPKGIIVDVYTDWCGWCKRMDKTTFSNKEVVDYINENFYAVKFDAEKGDSVVFKGQKLSPREIAKEFSVRSYPSTVFIDERNNLTTLVEGYKHANDFRKIMEFVADEHFKTTTWEDFRNKN